MFLPALLGMAGGAMLYVISDEMIPETHAHGFEKQATYALVAGEIEKKSGGYEIGLSDGVELKFNLLGQFKSMEMDD